MPPAFREIVDDVAAEHAALTRVLDALDADQWERPTHAPGWSVRDQVAHLAMFDEYATLGLTDTAAFAVRVDGDELQHYLQDARDRRHSDLLGWWGQASAGLVAAARLADGTQRCPWFGVEMSAASYITARLMECWSHGLDVVDVVAPAASENIRPDTDRLRHICHIGARTRPYAYNAREMNMPDVAVYLDLRLPSGASWTDGDPDAPNRIDGPAADFCRVVTQRRHPADTSLRITGPAAEEWMSIAQAFAGPPGEGRRPGQFPSDA